MTASRASKTFALSSLVTLGLLAGMTPASGTGPATPTPAASQEAQPSATEAAAPPAEPTRSSTVAPSPTAVPTPSADPSPSFEDMLTIRDYQQNPELLAELIGDHGASMGQGLDRLEATGDPQEPAPEEASSLSGSTIGTSDAESGAAIAPTATNYTQPSSGVLGVDVSSHQGAVNWGGAWDYGSRFAYVKATEALSYENPYFGSQYTGAEDSGMLRGAYHFAIPSVSSGAQQANYFVANGGGWSADGKTLPPLLDVEYNPYESLGNDCYNMTASQMVTWIRDFSNQIVALTGRKPMIYTTTDWWNRCTGSSEVFSDHALHIASYSDYGAGTLPAAWNVYSVWQYTSAGPVVGDWNRWNGNFASLRSFAVNTAGARELYFQGRSSTPTYFGGASDKFLSCDWNGDGISTPATYNNGVWNISPDLSGAPATRITYGDAGDQPICGDWNGDGVETIGIYRSGSAHLRNSNRSGFADGVVRFGSPGDEAIVGDWNRDGYDTLGVARAAGVAKRFYLTNSNLRPRTEGSFLLGNARDQALAGDWNGDGYTTVGVKRGNEWFQSNSNVKVAADRTFRYGDPLDRPLVGRWHQGLAAHAVGVAR